MAFDGHQPEGYRVRRRPAWLVAGAFVAPAVVIGAGVVVTVRSRAGGGVPGTEAAGPKAPALGPPAVVALAKSTVEFPPDDEPTLDLEPTTLGNVAEASPGDGAPSIDSTPLDEDGTSDDSADDAAPRKPAPPRHFATVREAEKGSCSTDSIEGLSKQIIAEAHCLNPSAVVPLPSRPNLVTGPHVFPFLQAEAKTHLMKVIDAHKNTTFKINSALRTVAQQYLVWRWSATKSCGVELATRPGESSHELGLAVDVADHTAWRSALESEQFRWLGATDKVHFDFKPAAATGPKGSMTDVLAFQRLWNRNHPTDRIREDGLYNAATEDRLKTAPADGFAVGAVCKSKLK